MVAAAPFIGASKLDGDRFPVKWRFARCRIRQADTLLWVPSRWSFTGNLIAACSRGRHSHADKALWLGDGDARELFAVGQLMFGRRPIRVLADEVQRYPGRIDWYRIKDRPGEHSEYNRERAALAMLYGVTARYGYLDLALTAFRYSSFARLGAAMRLPGFQWLMTAPPDNGRCRAMKCSSLVSRADRAGLVDPFHGLPDWQTDPADLARAEHLYEYQGSLVP